MQGQSRQTAVAGYLLCLDIRSDPPPLRMAWAPGNNSTSAHNKKLQPGPLSCPPACLAGCKMQLSPRDKPWPQVAAGCLLPKAGHMPPKSCPSMTGHMAGHPEVNRKRPATPLFLSWLEISRSIISSKEENKLVPAHSGKICPYLWSASEEATYQKGTHTTHSNKEPCLQTTHSHI